jgi:hypothetical protein
VPRCSDHVFYCRHIFNLLSVFWAKRNCRQ